MPHARHWTQQDISDHALPEHHSRSIEDQVELHRRTKALADCPLPQGIRLVTKTPRHARIDGLLLPAFVLAWHFGGKDLFWHVQRYDAQVDDETQMQWALDTFIQDLTDEGIKISLPQGNP